MNTVYDCSCGWPGCRGECHTGDTCWCHPEVNEPESWAHVIAVGAAFVICLVVVSMYLWLLAPAGAAYPR